MDSIMKDKSKTFSEFSRLIKQVQATKGLTVALIRSDHRSELGQEDFIEYNEKHGKSCNFLSLRTPQQDIVIERKNRTLEDMARTIICGNDPLNYF